MATYPYYNSYNYFPTQPNAFPTQQIVGSTQPTSIIWVKGSGEANAYPVAPNNAVALWDSEAPVIYLKQADASGRPTLKAFDLVEREPAPKEETDIMKTIAAMREDIDSLKNDFYGKKRKKEENE